MSGQLGRRPSPVPVSASPSECFPQQAGPPGLRPTTTAGGLLLAQRYRLVVAVGSDPRAGAEFWRAEDPLLERDVAVTVLRRLPGEPGSDDPHGVARAGEMIVRALRFGGHEHPGAARLLDVLAPTAGLPADVLGAAVAEWVPGRSLSETVATGMIKPVTAARMVQPLAAAVEAAHRHGLVLGCDHPQRVRITPDGRVQQAFVLPRPDLVPADDVRGLGAVLYALLTSRWPLSVGDATRAGLAAAPARVGGLPVPASRLRPGVPVELDALIAGTLGPDHAPGRVHTAAAVHRLLGQVIDEHEQQVVVFPPVPDGLPPAPDELWQDRERGSEPPDPQRRRKLTIGLSALGVGMLLVFGYLGVQLGALFAEPDVPRILVAAPPPTPPAPSAAPAAPRLPGAGSAAVRPIGVQVFDQTGDRDNLGRVGQIIDGDGSTSWQTYTYSRPFPAEKAGVGIMASFDSPVLLTGLSIDSPSAGSVVQIRSAPSATAQLSDSALVTSATLSAGVTQIALPADQPVRYLLIWITKLGGGGAQNVTQINEVRYLRAAD